MWIEGVKTDNPNIRRVAISLTYEAENQAYNDAVKKWETEQEDDWGKCCCGEAMEKLGLNTFIVCDTIYGDWSCTVFNSLTKEKMGEFCADSGQVGIFLMDEVLKYNPNLDLPKHCATIIKNFDGHVRVNKKNNGKYTYDGEEYDDIVALSIDNDKGYPRMIIRDSDNIVDVINLNFAQNYQSKLESVQ